MWVAAQAITHWPWRRWPVNGAGVDMDNMLAQARRKDVESRVIWRAGIAETLPLRQTACGVLVQLVLRHLTEFAAPLP